MSNMFSYCEGIDLLDLSKWDTSKVTDISSMFNDCRNLTEIKGIENFNTSNVINMDRLFYFCKKLNAEITIMHELHSYNNIFSNAAIESGSQIIVNYNNATKDYIDTYIATKSENSNVIKGINIDETIA